jgi:hypothetical protein
MPDETIEFLNEIAGYDAELRNQEDFQATQIGEKLIFTSGNLRLGNSTHRETFRARFVRAGRIRAGGNRESNIIVEPSALIAAQAEGKFDGKAVFVDHAGFFEYPSMRNLAGVTFNSEWNEDTDSVDGYIEFYSTAGEIVNLLNEILGDGEKAPDIGLSLVFWPRWAPRDSVEDPRRIIGITHVESVDLVFEPAADGRIIEALSAAYQSAIDTDQGELTMPDEILETTNTVSNPEPEREEPTIVNQAQEWTEALSASVAATMLNVSGLPEASIERLLNQHYSNPAEVETAIAQEREFLARLEEDHVINIGGEAPRGNGVQVGLNAIEKLSLAADALLTGRRPEKDVAPLSGIRELYLLLSGDYDLTGVFHGDRVQFANVNSSTMAGLVANALNKRVVNLFMEYPQWWAPIVMEEDFATLQDARWITLGGVGELPTVAEGAAYTELTWDDQTETDAFVKKGGYLGITLEAIDKDDTRRVQAAPRALAQAAWLTLGKSVSAIFTSNSGTGPTMSDSNALFDSSNHGNLGTTALSTTEYAAVRTAMRKQTEVNSSERLGALTAPKFILVPPDLEITALKVLASEHDYLYALSNGTAAPANPLAEGNDFNARMQSARDRVIVVDLWTDTNNWAAAADPRMYPTIGLGFRYGRQPEIFSVASPTAGLMFTNDTMPVKVRFFFAVGPMDWRGLYKENVA